MLTSASRRARQKKKVQFSLTCQDILPFPKVCPVLGIEMKTVGDHVRDHQSLSLDRLVPDLGYVPGNVRVISNRANSLKSDATIEELELVLAYMKRHAAQQEQQEQGSEPNNT